ncbi:MAG: CAP domain-containing protein, partial [Candidatus Rokuibacteriota bacterium]
GWAQHMASGGCGGGICHSNLSDGVSGDWRRLGENVGRGPSVDAIHQALVNSPGHYANLVDPGFRLVGVGVLNINGTLWVAQVFMEPASQPAPSTPHPRRDPDFFCGRQVQERRPAQLAVAFRCSFSRARAATRTVRPRHRG